MSHMVKPVIKCADTLSDYFESTHDMKIEDSSVNLYNNITNKYFIQLQLLVLPLKYLL